jgi:hypothetical protein
MLIFLDTYVPKAELVDFTVEKNVLFMAYLFEGGKSPNTISTYLEALSYYLKFKSKPDITNNFIIKKLVNGDKRLAAGPDINRPITVTVLGHLLQALAHVTKAYYQRIMFEAMFLLACFTFLRIGEITSRSKTYPNLCCFRMSHYIYINLVKLQLI